MDNQHRLIKGYRELSQPELDVMNTIKAHGERCRALFEDVETFVKLQELVLEDDIEALRWIDIARTHAQQALMALTRAVARPQGF